MFIIKKGVTMFCFVGEFYVAMFLTPWK